MKMKNINQNSAVKPLVKAALAGLLVFGTLGTLKSQELMLPNRVIPSSNNMPFVQGSQNPRDVNNYAVDFLKFTGNPSSAIPYFLKAIECGGSAAVHYNLGTAYLLAGKLADALSSLDRAIKDNPSFALAHYNRACVLVAIGNMDDALVSFKRAIALGGPINGKTFFVGLDDALSSRAPRAGAFVKIQQ